MLAARPSTAIGISSPRTPRGNNKPKGKSGKTFIVAVDGSAGSMRGLQLAAALCRPEDGVQVITVSVGMPDVPDPSTALASDSARSGTLSPEGLLAACRASLISHGTAAKQITTRLVDPEERTIAEALIRESDKRPSAVLVLGCYGKGAIRRPAEAAALREQGAFGSVTESALLHCRCPLALVKERLIYGPGPQKAIRPMVRIVCCVDALQWGQVCV